MQKQQQKISKIGKVFCQHESNIKKIAFFCLMTTAQDKYFQPRKTSVFSYVEIGNTINEFYWLL